MSNALKIFIDGACQGNPGPAGIGVVLADEKNIIKEFSQPIGEATNNIAEYSALIFGLIQALSLKAKKIQVYCDSELVCHQVCGRYKVKNIKLKFLYQQALGLLQCFQSVDIRHIGRLENTKADQLATRSLQYIQSNSYDRPEEDLFREESPSSPG